MTAELGTLEQAIPRSTLLPGKLLLARLGQILILLFNLTSLIRQVSTKPSITVLVYPAVSLLAQLSQIIPA